MKENDLHITIFPTSRCDTGCQICLSDSKPTGIDLNIKAFYLLTKSIKKYKGWIDIVFTGFGEPLMWPHLPEAIKTLRKIKNVRYIQLITSGCLDEKDSRLKILQESIKADPYLIVTHSFHAYGGNMPQRLKFTLPVILESNAQPSTFIRMTIKMPYYRDEAQKKLQKNFAFLDQTLKQTFGPIKKLGLIRWHNNEKNFKELESDYLRSNQINTKVGDFLSKERYLDINTTYYIPLLSLPNKRVVIIWQNAALAGRLSKYRKRGNLKKIAYVENCCYWRHESKDDKNTGKQVERLILDSNGRFVFCPFKTQFDFPYLKIGGPGGDLRKPISRFSIIYNEIDFGKAYLETNPYYLCDACVQQLRSILNPSNNFPTMDDILLEKQKRQKEKFPSVP